MQQCLLTAEIPHVHDEEKHNHYVRVLFWFIRFLNEESIQQIYCFAIPRLFTDHDTFFGRLDDEA